MQLLLLSRSQPQVLPQVPLHPPSPIPLPPGADVEALGAASSPVSMTTRVTSAPGLSITARTPQQLNADSAVLIAAEMFLVPKKEGEGWVCGWARRCRRWRKIPRSLLAVFAVTTHAVPRRHRGLGCCQKYPFLSLGQSLASSAPLPPLQMLGWPLVSGALWRGAEG